MRRFLCSCLPFALALSLVACSGRAGSSIGPAGAVPGAPPAAAQTTLVIHVPKHRHSRHAHYVSVSSASLEVEIVPDGGCAHCSPSLTLDAGLSAGSPGCVQAANGATCSIAFKLNPGSYTGSVTTYDGQLVASKPTGTVLSLAHAFPFDVVAGKANAPAVTLEGVPAGISLLPITSGNLSYQNAGLQILGGSSTARALIYALDADLNAIVGPGAPTFTASAGGGFNATVTGGNTLRVTAPPSVTSGAFPLVISAASPACSQVAATCVLSTSVGFQPIAAVADLSTQSVVIVAAYPSNPKKAWATVTAGIADPAAVAFDAHGNLFVANESANTVTEYAPPYDGPPLHVMSTGIDAPTALAVAPNGSVAVYNSAGPSIEVFAPPYATATGTISGISWTFSSMIFDAGNELWVSYSSVSVVSRFAPPYAATTSDRTITSVLSNPRALAIGDNGSLYVASVDTPAVYTFAAPAFTSYEAVSLLPGVTSLSAGDGYLAACAPTGLDIYKQLTLAYVNDLSSSSGCTATLDSQGNVWTMTPGDPEVDFNINGGGGSWYLTGDFVTPLIGNPTALAVYPP